MDIWLPEVEDRLILHQQPENVVDHYVVSATMEISSSTEDKHHEVGHLQKLTEEEDTG